MDTKKNKKQSEFGMEEIGEDATKYGEFVSSYFAWVPMEKQKDRVEELENITKERDKKRK